LERTARALAAPHVGFLAAVDVPSDYPAVTSGGLEAYGANDPLKNVDRKKLP